MTLSIHYRKHGRKFPEAHQNIRKNCYICLSLKEKDRVMLKKGIFLLSLIATCNAYAQDVAPYTPGTLSEGIVYYLPKTELEIKIVATQINYHPGELCQYAERYLRLQNISSQPSTHWEIKSIIVTPIGSPDPTAAYSIKLKDKSVSSQVELTDDGIIKAINTISPKEETKVQPTPKKVERIDPRSFMTEEMLMAGSSTKMAELIAKEIYSIRESKNSLNRGQADYMPEDGKALGLMLENLNKQEKAMTEMFSGYTEKTDRTFTYIVSPNEDLKDAIICRFSSKLGVLKSNNLAGEPIFINITQKKTLPQADEEAMKKKKLNGIIYKVPGKAAVTITSTNNEYFKKELPFAQFGETEVLVDDLFNKKINTRVIFNPTTGGIVKIDKD